MNDLFDQHAPFGPRDDAAFLAAMNELTRAHLEGCVPYARIWPGFGSAENVEALPWLHVGLFKQLEFRTDAAGIRHERVLNSSATGSGVASQIALDRESSERQAASSLAILRDFVGSGKRPLLVLDSARSLVSRDVSARVAAAMSLKPLATDLHFVLADADRPESMKWDVIERLLADHDELLVYGFTWMLWLAWADANVPESLRSRLADTRVHFVHSGGWKKLESLSVGTGQFNQALTQGTAAGSSVTDFYGLVEQVGIVYPLCEVGYRHVPVWADVLVRDSWSMASLVDTEGQLQLMNTLARGAPYHNVLTEDLGRIVPGECACGRSGKRFELLGRVPSAEIRGCANV